MTAALVAILAPGCVKAPTAPSDERIALRVNEARDLPEFRLTFVEVESDSRCPVEAMCVWAGNATVIVTAQLPFTKNIPPRLSLNSNLEPRSVGFAGMRIRLESLAPQPRINPPIAPSEYIAHFTVARAVQ